MTDAAVLPALTVRRTEPEALFLVETWGDGAAVERRLAATGIATPAPCRSASSGDLRLIWWEPNTWLIRAPKPLRDETAARLTEALAGEGAVTEVSGAFVRVRVEGALWRSLLMIGGVFDAEAESFGPGSVAGTVIHHLPVRLDVIGDSAVDAYVPPSYAADLLHHWTAAAGRLR